jgi:hypothetical protein
MTLQTLTELILALGAVLLLARDTRRAWLDRFRRPVSLLAAALIGVVLLGAIGGRSHPSPWWLLVPAGVLAWEVARGWRRAARWHLGEAGLGAFSTGLLAAALGLGLGASGVRLVLLSVSAVAAVAGAVLLLLSRRREPRPGRSGDPGHYERRLAERNGGCGR